MNKEKIAITGILIGILVGIIMMLYGIHELIQLADKSGSVPLIKIEQSPQ